MVTQNQSLMSIQPGEDFSRVMITTKKDITEMIHLILRHHLRVPVRDHGFIHMIHIIEPIASKGLTGRIKELQHVRMIEVGI